MVHFEGCAANLQCAESQAFVPSGAWLSSFNWKFFGPKTVWQLVVFFSCGCFEALLSLLASSLGPRCTEPNVKQAGKIERL